MIVRPREAGDLPALVTALRAVHERDGYPVTWKADPAAWLTPDGMCAAWVVECDGRPVGHAALTTVEDDEPAAGAWSLATGLPAERLRLLTRLYVTLDARGRGVGVRLLDTAVQSARDDGRTAVLEVSPADTPAVALYRRHGWRDAGPGPSRWWVPGGGTSLLLVAPPDVTSDASPARPAAGAPGAASAARPPRGR